jgi:hypothetical protein
VAPCVRMHVQGDCCCGLVCAGAGAQGLLTACVWWCIADHDPTDARCMPRAHLVELQHDRSRRVLLDSRRHAAAMAC